MKNKWFCYLVILCGVFLPCSVKAKTDNTLPVVRIGIVIDGEYKRNEEIFNLFKNEILDLIEREFKVIFPEDKVIVADWTVKGIRSAIDRLLSDPEVDILIAFGVISSHHICILKDIPKPVIAPFVIDPKIQGLPIKGMASGIKNLSYVVISPATDESFKIFHDIFPFRKIIALQNKFYAEAVPDLKQRISNAVEEIGVEVRIIPLGDTVDDFFEILPRETEAVYIAPLFSMPSSEFDRLIAGLIERRIPSFSIFRREDVEKGVFAGLVPKAFFSRIARRVALNLQRILLGEEAGDLPIAFPHEETLIINMATARAIGVWPSWEILTEAELLNEEMEEIERRITLSDAVHEAIEANLDLAAKDKSVLVGMQRIRQARSGLFPHLNVSATGIVIDKDRARASFGSQAERSLSSSATLSQVIYSDSAMANVDIQRHLYRSIKNEQEQLRLDIALDAALAYLNVLKAKTYERIQKENLELTKSNFETARRREAIGVSGPSEVYRWESQIATSRQAVIEAEANRRLAETDLNRILHRPLEERFIIEETGLNDPILITSGGRMEKYTNNPWTFRVFRDFLVEEGIQNSFQLKVIDAAIAAQNRTLVMAKRAFWAPTITLQGGLTEMIAEDGVGTESGFGAGMPSTLSGLFTEADDTDWSLALNLSFPLYSGGSKRATQKMAEEELSRLRLEREAVKEHLDQRIRSSVHHIGTSHPNIRLSRDAAEAAQKNLDLVKDAYSRGLVSIIELLDAQNAALVADQMAANAAYDFLIDLMKSQGAIGRMDFFITQKDREAFFKSLDDYFRKRGITLPDE